MIKYFKTFLTKEIGQMNKRMNELNTRVRSKFISSKVFLWGLKKAFMRQSYKINIVLKNSVSIEFLNGGCINSYQLDKTSELHWSNKLYMNLSLL